MKPKKSRVARPEKGKRDALVSITYRLPKSALEAVDRLAEENFIGRNAALNIGTSRLIRDGIDGRDVNRDQ